MMQLALDPSSEIGYTSCGNETQCSSAGENLQILQRDKLNCHKEESMKSGKMVRCAKCSGRLILEEITERVAHYEILDDGSYSPSPTDENESFWYHLSCENLCCDVGFKFNPYAGEALPVCEE